MKTSKAKQILEAIEFGRENSSQIAKRIGTSPKYVRKVAEENDLTFPSPTSCKHCGEPFEDPRPGRYARSSCDTCKRRALNKRARDRRRALSNAGEVHCG